MQNKQIEAQIHDLFELVLKKRCFANTLVGPISIRERNPLLDCLRMEIQKHSTLICELREQAQ